MDNRDGLGAAQYLTTREVADLLRVKERKVYDLAGAGEIPHRRITGKLLFPAAEIAAWIEGAGQPSRGPRPGVVAGSHDPLLDWAIRESGCGLATLFDGSTDGLRRFGDGAAALCGLHIPQADDWNIAAVAALGTPDCVLIGWARRVQGLIVANGDERRIAGLSDLAGRRVIRRQSGAGARQLFDRMATGLDLSRVSFLPEPARTETDAAQAVAMGEADAALGLQAAARQFRLGFIPIVEERFDLLIDRRAHFTEPVQTLLAFARGDRMLQKAEALGGYDLSGLGKVRWLSD